MHRVIRISVLREARKDLKYLLNRGYNKPSALKLVGDRYQLNKPERSILFRSVFSDREAEIIRSKRIGVGELRGRRLLVDGFNVLNTVEAILRGEPLILCDDGVLRDFAEIHSKYRFSELTGKALKLILDFLRRAGVSEVEVLYEGQISRSGEVAALTRRIMAELAVDGEGRTAKTVDSILSRSHDVIATSDSAILLRCRSFIDLPGSLEVSRGIELIKLTNSCPQARS